MHHVLALRSPEACKPHEMEMLPTGVNAIGFATGWMVHHGEKKPNQKPIIRILRFLKVFIEPFPD